MDSSATYTEKQTEEKEKSKAIPRSLNTHRANLARGIKGIKNYHFFRSKSNFILLSQTENEVYVWV